MPRMRDTMRSGWKGSSASYFSPMPMNLMGWPVTLANRKRRAAAGITVHLGEHDAGERKLLVELVGGVDRVLSGHGVGDEQDFLRIEQLLERLHFVHQLIVDVQAAGGVDDQNVAAGVDGFAARFLGEAFDGRGVGFARLCLRRCWP